MTRRVPRLALLLALAACQRGHDAPSSSSADGASAAASPAAFAAPARDPVEAVVDSLAATMPRFEDHPAREVHRGPPAPVELASAPGAARFRTALREGAARGPNFAGRYTVVTWGCGSPCTSFAIVDARTGRVTFGPHPLTHGAAFRLESELLIADPLEHWRGEHGELATEAIGGAAMARYYRWDGRRLVPLDSLPIGRAHFGAARGGPGR